MSADLELSRSVLLGHVYQTRRRFLLDRCDALTERAVAEGDVELASHIDGVRADLEAAGIKDLRCGFALYTRWLDKAESQVRVLS